MRCILASTALATLLLAAPAARASWPAGGQVVLTPENGFNGVRAVRFLELPSGELAVIGVGNGSSAYGYSLQRLRFDGALAPGWPAPGLSLWQVAKSNEFHLHGFATDDSGNVWHTFATSSAGRVHIATPDAIVVPSAITPWTTPGVGPTRAHVAPGKAGDVFFVPANGRVLRFLRSGLIAPGWPASGVPVGASGTGNTDIIADGAGGAILFAFNASTGGRAFAQRVDPSGARHAGWPAGGLTLGADSLGDNITVTPAALLHRSGTDHFLAVWLALETPLLYAGRHKVIMQRFALDGTLDPAWPAAGLTAVAMDTISAFTALGDGAGGLYLLWLRRGLPRATHVLANGTFAPGLDGAGVSLLDAGAQYVPATYPISIPQDELPAALSRNGNLMFAWSDARSAPAVSYHVRWFRSDLTPDPLAPVAGVVVTPGSPHATSTGLLGLHSDGADGAIIAWSDYHDVSPTQIAGDIWMDHVVAPPLLDAPPSPVRTGTLALSAPRPNPARDRARFELVLPDEGAAELELLDVAGRVLKTRAVQGAGAREVAFDHLDRLPPGLYFARLRGREVRVARLVLTR